MDKLSPKLFYVLKNYTKEQFFKDVISGIIVAIIALPLSIALALASGVEPQVGIYTAITAEFIISFLGGSRVQIAGPTAAFATIVAGIVAEKGMEGLVVATIMAGIILIIMGFCRLGNLIKFIPYTITTGFTAGIAVTIFIGQIKDFLGVDTSVYHGQTIDTIGKIKALGAGISAGGISVAALLIGLLSLAILIVWPKINKIIPPSLIAVIAAGAVVYFAGLSNGDVPAVKTIGTSFDIPMGLPKLYHFENFHVSMIRELMPNAFTIAILAAIESLLSCVVSDGMIGSRTRTNMELIAQGAGNIGSALFGGIPATGAIARTAANVKNGGRSPVAGMVHAIVLCLMLLVLMPLVKLIPMPCIAAILFMVAYNMSGWRAVASTLKHAPKSDIAVLLVSFVLTVVLDLVYAIVVGLVLASLLFMKRMSDVTNVEGWEYIDDYNRVKTEDENYDEETDPDNIKYKSVPKNTLVFEITGPLFFGAADKLSNIVSDTDEDIIILRMRSVPAMDTTVMHTLEGILATCRKHNITLIFSHVNEQPMAVMEKAGFVEQVGKDKFCKNIDEALAYAEKIETDRRGR